MRNVNHKEFYKRLQFKLKTKWYMLKSESVLENETYKNYETQMDHLIPTG